MNSWITIWFKPRQTIRQIVEAHPGGVMPLVLMSASMAATMLMQVPVWQRMGASLPVATTLALVCGTIIGAITLYLFGWLYRWVGSWFGGQAKNVEVRAAIAWVEVPTFVILACWLVLVVPAALSGGAGQAAGSLGAAGTVLFALVAGILGIWKLVLACHAVGEVHRFSAWKGLGTLLIPNLIIMVPIIFFGLFAAIAIPNVLRARVVANQSQAIGTLRSAITALELRRADRGSYPATTDWHSLTVEPSLHTSGALTSHEFGGYRYTYASAGGSQYALRAVPIVRAGISFFVDETGFMRHCIPTAQKDEAGVEDREITQEAGPCQ